MSSMKLNSNIKILRKQRGMTQQAFADALGIKRASVGAYEENRATFREDLIPAVARLLKIRESDLLGLDFLIDPVPPVYEGLKVSGYAAPERNPLPSAEPMGHRQFDLTEKTDTPSPSETESRQQPIEQVESVLSDFVSRREEESRAEHKIQEVARKPSPAINSKKEEGRLEDSFLKGQLLRQQTLVLDESNNPLVSIIGSGLHQEYLKKLNNPNWIAQLPIMTWPAADAFTAYRAFQWQEHLTRIGCFVRNWLTLEIGKKYIIVANGSGIATGIIKQVPSLSTPLVLELAGIGNGSIEIASQDLLEIWKIVAVINDKPDEVEKSPVDKLAQILEELQKEISSLKASGTPESSSSPS